MILKTMVQASMKLFSGRQAQEPADHKDMGWSKSYLY